MSEKNILTCLGIAVLIAGILCVVIFIAERLGISPAWDLISIPGFTGGENVIFLVGGIFIALLILGAIFGATGGIPGKKPGNRRK